MSVVLGKQKGSATVHSLVMLAFVGPRPDGLEVCHNNGVASDNRLSNLRYDTRSENNVDSSKHGKRGFLNEQQVRALREAVGIPGAISSLAQQFGVGLSCASNAAHKRSYGWVK
jgi:hypothetical protein